MVLEIISKYNTILCKIIVRNLQLKNTYETNELHELFAK